MLIEQIYFWTDSYDIFQPANIVPLRYNVQELKESILVRSY